MDTLKKLLALALALTACAVFAAPAQAQGPGPEELLGLVPLSAYDGWLTYADLDAMAALYGAEMPAGTEEFWAMDGSPEEGRLMAAFLALSSGPPDFFRNMMKSREFLASSGFDFFHVRRVLEVGAPPDRQFWLAGDFGAQPIRDALAAKGYEQVNTGFAGREAWAPGGDLAGGGKTDLAGRDPYFLFGGTLGQSWPVVQMPGVIASGRGEAGMRAVAMREGPALTENAVISDALHAVRAYGGDGAQVAQLYLLTAGSAGLSGAGDLPEFKALAMAHAFTGGAQWTLLALSYPDAATAEEAARILRERLAGEVALPSGTTLQALVAARGGA
ncbi:MAG TPA: hypothetical protein VLA21_05925, partial [Candidatus Limnocylindria bacterium]|nr:hypothetical protein [Candidatus Limnocylindria bacterium]